MRGAAKASGARQFLKGAQGAVHGPLDRGGIVHARVGAGSVEGGALNFHAAQRLQAAGGEGTASGGQPLHRALDEQHHAVLPQGDGVFFAQGRAAARGNNLSRLLAEAGDDLAFEGAEDCLALCAEDLRDGHAGRAKESYAEHKAIYEAVAAHDPDEAERLVLTAL